MLICSGYSMAMENSEIFARIIAQYKYFLYVTSICHESNLSFSGSYAIRKGIKGKL